jgi:hypothetical protein
MRKFLFIFLTVVVGCAPWIQVGGLYTSDGKDFSADLPEGWMRLRQSEQLFITRDGILLQTITVESLNASYEFKNTKKKLSKGMLPQEVSEVILDNISSDQQMSSFEIVENSPAKIGGLTGFKAVFSYGTKGGLKYKSVYYGALDGERFYGLRYTAARRYYFDKDISTFEKTVSSFRILKKA